MLHEVVSRRNKSRKCLYASSLNRSIIRVSPTYGVAVTAACGWIQALEGGQTEEAFHGI